MITKLGSVITEYSVRNKKDEDIPVYSVTNEQGFCTGYFSKDVASKDRTTYKIVPRGYFAYNPSRINVGSVDWQDCEDRVIVSPLYVVFGVDKKLDQQYLLHYHSQFMVAVFQYTQHIERQIYFRERFYYDFFHRCHLRGWCFTACAAS